MASPLAEISSILAQPAVGTNRPSAARYLLFFQRRGLRKFEGQRAFRRQHNILVAGESRARRACTRARGSANGRAAPAAGDPADQRSQTGAATDGHRAALAFAFHGP